MHTDVVFTDLHTELGPIRSYDHNEDDVHMRVPVKMATKSENFSFASLFSQIFTNIHKYCWNTVYLCQTEGFKMKIVDIYI